MIDDRARNKAGVVVPRFLRRRLCPHKRPATVDRNKPYHIVEVKIPKEFDEYTFYPGLDGMRGGGVYINDYQVPSFNNAIYSITPMNYTPYPPMKTPTPYIMKY